MLIVKQAKQEPAPFVAPVNFLLLDDKLRKQFEATANQLNQMKDRSSVFHISLFVRQLILEADFSEILHFGRMRSQRALYDTLREWIRLNLHKCGLSECYHETVLTLAAQFLTEGFCWLNEPNNIKHQNNRWSYAASLELYRLLKRMPRAVDCLEEEEFAAPPDSDSVCSPTVSH